MTSSDLILAVSSVVLTLDVAWHLTQINASSWQSSENKKRFRQASLSLQSTPQRRVRQSCDHWHEGFCWSYHISPRKEKAARLVPVVREKETLGAAECSLPAFLCTVLFLTPGIPLQVGFTTQQSGTQISLQGEGNCLTLTKRVKKKKKSIAQLPR